MGWLQILLLVLRYGPTVYGIIKEIIKYIKKLREANVTFFADADPERRFADELNAYKVTRNVEGLRALRDDLKSIAKGLRV